MCVCVYRTEFFTAETRPTDVLSLPDSRAGEGISVQPLPHTQTAHRDSACALPHRAPDQDLVSEPPHEGQEGKAADQGTQRAWTHDLCRPAPLADVEPSWQTGVSVQLGARPSHLLRDIEIDLLVL